MKRNTNLLNFSPILLSDEDSEPEAPSLKEKKRHILGVSYILAPKEDTILEEITKFERGPKVNNFHISNMKLF